LGAQHHRLLRGPRARRLRSPESPAGLAGARPGARSRAARGEHSEATVMAADSGAGVRARAIHVSATAQSRAPAATVFALLKDGTTWPSWTMFDAFELE